MFTSLCDLHPMLHVCLYHELHYAWKEEDNFKKLTTIVYYGESSIVIIFRLFWRLFRSQWPRHLRGHKLIKVYLYLWGSSVEISKNRSMSSYHSNLLFKAELLRKFR